MKTVFFILALMVTDWLYAQALLYGHLSDQDNGHAIPFANIGVLGTPEGTAATAEGDFQLKVKIGDGKFINISCIGYHSRRYSIDSLLAQGSIVHDFSLQQDVELLDEVIVRQAPIDPAEIIKLAISSIESNYYQKPFNMEVFSTIEANDSLTDKNFTVESVLLGYYNGYKKGIQRSFEILQVRKTGDDPLRQFEYGYWPSFEIYQADQITKEFEQGIFNTSFLGKFELQYAGVSLYEDDTVYQINYRLPKPTTKITGYGITPKRYEGTIYITTSSNAIVRHEILTESFSYMVIYKRYEGKYFPYLFSGKRTNRFKFPNGSREFSNHNNIAVLKIILESVKVAGSKRNEFDIYLTNYDSKFWETNYPKK